MQCALKGQLTIQSRVILEKRTVSDSQEKVRLDRGSIPDGVIGFFN
jgi:hypothetical protein